MTGPSTDGGEAPASDPDAKPAPHPPVRLVRGTFAVADLDDFLADLDAVVAETTRSASNA